MLHYFVKALFFFSLFFFLTGCGLHVQENFPSLPRGAQTIALAKINNQTAVPAAAIVLEQALYKAFNEQHIRLVSKKFNKYREIDLVLQVTIHEADIRAYTVTYNSINRHSMHMETSINLLDQRRKNFVFSNYKLGSDFAIDGTADNMTDAEKDRVTAETSKIMSKKIANYVFNWF